MVAVLIFLILEKIQNSFPKINMVGALCIISLKKKKLPTWTEKYAFYFQSQIARFCVVWRDTRIIFNVWFSGVIQLWRVFNEGSNLIRLICKFLSITWWNYVWLKLKKKKKKSPPISYNAEWSTPWLNRLFISQGGWIHGDSVVEDWCFYFTSTAMNWYWHAITVAHKHHRLWTHRLHQHEGVRHINDICNHLSMYPNFLL